jgi:D-sedoheptulose 7-phosphate isomerase
LTAWGNDKTFESFFSRQVEALGVAGDALIVISTSGNSKNILLAAEKAKGKGIKVFGLLGRGGGLLYEKGICDEVIIVPSDSTPHIQESHIMLIHIICEALDTFFVEREVGM